MNALGHRRLGTPASTARRVAALLALVAACTLALLPTLSRALAASGAGLAAPQVCTPHGLQPVPDGTPAAGLQLDACVLCALGAAAASTPLTPAAWPPRGGGAVLQTANAPAAARPQWRPCAARAPPARS